MYHLPYMATACLTTFLIWRVVLVSGDRDFVPALVRTRPVPKRPFQGWRYLKPEDAPADLSGSADGTLPVELESELSELGLL